MGADGRLVGLKSVLLVPGLCANLLSTKALSEAGMKMEMMGTKVFKATLDGRVLWGLRGGKDMHRSMWEIPVLPWKEAATRLAAESVRGGHASHVTSGGCGDGSDGGLLVHWGGALPSVTPSTGETDWLIAHRRFGQVELPQLQLLFKEERVKGLRIKGEPKEKSDAARVIIEEWLPMVERESGKRVKAIRSDRGGEFLGAEFRSWLKRHDIKKQLTTAYTPQSNGVAEKANRTIIEGGRTILVDSGLPLWFWPLTIRHATVIKNQVLTHVGGQHWVPMENWSGKKPLVDMLRVFGCMGLVHVPKERRDKLQAAAVWAVHLGLAQGSKGWLMWDPKSNTIFTTRDAKFMEGLMFKEWSERGRSKVTIPLGIEVGTNDPLLIPIDFSPSSELTKVSHDLGGAEGEAADVEEVMQQGEALVAERGDTEEEVQQPTPSPKLPPRCTTQGKRDAVRGGAKEGAAKERPKRAAHPRDFLKYERLGVPKALLVQEEEDEEEKGAEEEMEQICCFGANLPHEPASMEEALAGDDREAWLASREDEFQSHMENETWTVVNEFQENPALEQHVKAVERTENETRSTGGQVGLYHPPFEKCGLSRSSLQEGAKRREPKSRPASPFLTSRRVPRPRPPPVSDTHIMVLHPSTIPQLVPLPPPPESSLPAVPDPNSGLAHAASPTVPRLLATVVTDSLFESTAAFALVAELVDFAAACRLDYATSLVAESESDSPPFVRGECALGTDVHEDMQKDIECLAAPVSHLVAMLLAREGDPDAPDIPTPRSYAKAIMGPYSSQWHTLMDAEMASWKSTGTYVNAVPPSGRNKVNGMWIFRVMRPSGSPPVFKAHYVARCFSQRRGVDFFLNFSPTPKMTTLWALLYVAA
ncbi:unnamed protein product [Closterium sp. NIES-54]